MRSLRAVLAASLVVVSALSGGAAHAQSASELAAGRQLFVEALADEENGRFAAALEKYKRVQGIRDTVNVRYRIGTSLEGLGKVARAVDAYAAAIQLASESNADAEVVRGARARLEVLRPRVAHVSVRVTPPAFADAEVSIDSERIPAQSYNDVSVDPGAHVVTAQAKGARPFRAELTLYEGGHADLAVVLEPLEAPPPPPPPPASADHSGTYRTAGIVTGAAGGLLVIGGAVVLALRSSNISDLNESCPDGRCPASREQELRSTRDRAVLQGPVGAAMLITGAVALGTGIVLYAVPGRDTTAAVTRFVPSPTAQGAMLSVVRSF